MFASANVSRVHFQAVTHVFVCVVILFVLVGGTRTVIGPVRGWARSVVCGVRIIAPLGHRLALQCKPRPISVCCAQPKRGSKISSEANENESRCCVLGGVACKVWSGVGVSPRLFIIRAVAGDRALLISIDAKKTKQGLKATQGLF
jgi:hypothetical protein